MPVLYLMRHAESEANTLDILASRKDFPLTPQGHKDAKAAAESFTARFRAARLFSSPLLRAQQTAQPFASLLGLAVQLDDRLVEQNIGRFTGLTHAEAKADPAYVTDKTARWDWVPDGGGESYRMIAQRVQSFLDEVLQSPGDVFVVTHAVTLRLFRACLENTLPHYPETILPNAGLWTCRFEHGSVQPHSSRSLIYG